MARDTAPEHLHPRFRLKVNQLISKLEAEGLPFRMFEGFRSARRQHELYQQGRSKPGARVTNADAWSSLHQYGVAADFVLYIDGQWSWDTSKNKKSWWQRLHELARQHQLEPLSWELPHLQLQQMSLSQLRAGIYPDGGDEDWADNLQLAIAQWSGHPPAPLPPTLISARPPLPADAPVEDLSNRPVLKRATVIARDGLRLRAGPGTGFDVIRSLLPGLQLTILASHGDWRLVDIEGDGLADGYCHGGYLASA